MRNAIGILAVLALAAPAAAQQSPTPAGGPPEPVLDAPFVRPPAAVVAFARPAVRALQARGAWPRVAGDLTAPATRRELARVLAALRPGARVPAGDPASDVSAADPDARAVALAVRRGWITRRAGATFAPDAPLTAAVADAAVVRWLGLLPERIGLKRIHDASGQRLVTPPNFATEVLAREARLRRNYPASQDRYELSAGDVIRRADLADIAYRASVLPAHRRNQLRVFRTIQLPALSPTQKALVEKAFSYVGHPYIWGGEVPTAQTPWDAQAHPGFDCSGLVWGVYKLGVPGQQGWGEGELKARTADDMAFENPAQNVKSSAFQPGDLVFFGPRGPKSPRGSISHTGIALGNGWLIHSSGSISGPSVTYMQTYWSSGVAWGRRLTLSGAGAPTPAEAAPTTPLPVTPGASGGAPR